MTTKISNSELGAIYTTKILSLLLQEWPRPMSISCGTITGVEFDEESIFYNTTKATYPREWRICSDLIVWLENENFIRTKGAAGSIFNFSQVEITMLAMTALNQKPDPLDPESSRTLKDTLKDCAKNGALKISEKIMDQAFFAVISAVGKSIT